MEDKDYNYGNNSNNDPDRNVQKMFNDVEGKNVNEKNDYSNVPSDLLPQGGASRSETLPNYHNGYNYNVVYEPYYDYNSNGGVTSNNPAPFHPYNGIVYHSNHHTVSNAMPMYPPTDLSGHYGAPPRRSQTISYHAPSDGRNLHMRQSARGIYMGMPRPYRFPMTPRHLPVPSQGYYPYDTPPLYRGVRIIPNTPGAAGADSASHNHNDIMPITPEMLSVMNTSTIGSFPYMDGNTYHNINRQRQTNHNQSNCNGLNYSKTIENDKQTWDELRQGVEKTVDEILGATCGYDGIITGDVGSDLFGKGNSSLYTPYEALLLSSKCDSSTTTATGNHSQIDLSISSEEELRNRGELGTKQPAAIDGTCRPPCVKETPLIQTTVSVAQSALSRHHSTLEPSLRRHSQFDATNARGNVRSTVFDSSVASRVRSLGENLDRETNLTMTPAHLCDTMSEMTLSTSKPVAATSSSCLHGGGKHCCVQCSSEPSMVPFESMLTRMSSSSNYCPIKPSTNAFCQRYNETVPPQTARRYYASNNVTRALAHSVNPSQVIKNQHHSVVGSSSDIYSRKVFVGGLPQDITENQIEAEFKIFGELVVDWPHKMDNNSGLPPKGYAFLLFERAESVVNLISRCSKVDEKFFWTVSSHRSESKQVQVRPWTLTDVIWPLDSSIISNKEKGGLTVGRRIVFVGGIPRQAQAKELFDNINRFFGGVLHVEIDVDIEFKYPKGAASVMFDNEESYIKALETHFITLKLCGMEKRVEIKPYFSDDQTCENCGILMSSRMLSNSSNGNAPVGQCFCISRGCAKYFCEKCWAHHMEQTGHAPPHQSHNSKATSYHHRQFQYRKANNYYNSGQGPHK